MFYYKQISMVEHHLDKDKWKYLSMGTHSVNTQIGNYKCRARPRVYPHNCTFACKRKSFCSALRTQKAARHRIVMKTLRGSGGESRGCLLVCCFLVFWLEC